MTIPVPDLDLAQYDAVLFDLDGVLTTTSRLHSAAWKRLFDEFLADWDREHGTETTRFSVGEDYARYVDGKPRYDGVRDFLASRDISLPEGTDDSSPDEVSIHGLGNKKQEYVEQAIRDEGVEAFPGSVAWLRELRVDGKKTAVVSASRNCADVLDAAGIADLFDTRVDGTIAAERGLNGKPQPDTFLEAAGELGVEPARAIVVEDALAGVAAGRAGHFGLVIGVDRLDHADRLYEHGADVVVEDLAELVTTSHTVGRPVGPKEHRLRTAANRLLAAGDEFPIEEFRLVERRLNLDFVPQLETVFAVTNGYLGVRGSHDEGRPAHESGTLLNGFYESWPLQYPEGAFGFATTGQTILRVSDAARVRLYLDDEPFDLRDAEIVDYERALDMRQGTVDRRVVWRSPDGHRFSLRTRRLASLEYRHLCAFEYELTALDASATAVVVSDLAQPDGVSHDGPDDPRRGPDLTDCLDVLDARADEQRVRLSFRTKSSERLLSCGAEHEVHCSCPVHTEAVVDGTEGRVTFRLQLEPGRPFRLLKYVAYHHDGDLGREELELRVGATLDRATELGFDEICAAQRRRIDEFWDLADVRTEGAPLLQQAVRFSLFQLLQATARVEGHGLPAKGLTGAGYEGHYFWDTEIYVLPFLVHTAPGLARSLLRHRYDMLPAARRRARDVSEEGALFPWRTIGGEEASAYYAAGTAQYHINADVAYAVTQYVRATGDLEFLARYGVEILVETARLWISLGFFSDRRDGQFVINGVTGPDEYSTVVDNNTYTNLMAKSNLLQAVRGVAWLRSHDPGRYGELEERIGLRDDEPDLWERAAAEMYVPYDQRAGLHLQDDDFLDREPWDFENTPPENYPLLLHYHPLVIYRHQVIKQADVVLAAFLLGEYFTDLEKRAIFDYYGPLTTGDSSLSESIESIVAAEIGELRAAEEYLVDAASIDVADVAGNLRDGVHVASAGGTWMALVHGFGGLRLREDGLWFSPALPERLTALRFAVRFRDSVLQVDIEEDGVVYTIRDGPRLRIHHLGEPRIVEPGTPLHCELVSSRA